MGPSFYSDVKQQFKQWKHPGSHPPKKARTVPSADYGLTFLGYLWFSDGGLIYDTYYASLLRQLGENMTSSAVENSVCTCASTRTMLVTSLSLPWLS